jgi:ATP-dependent DNA helicase RecG
MGVDIIQDQMSASLLEPPVFQDDGASVTVLLPLARTVSRDEYAWITRATAQQELTASDSILLVAAARGQALTNKAARTLLRSDSVEVRASLQRLCQLGLLVQEGQRSGARYRLADELPALSSRRSASEADLQEAVLGLVARGPVANADVRDALGLDRLECLRLLNRMVSEGKLTRSGIKRGTRYGLPDGRSDI